MKQFGLMLLVLPAVLASLEGLPRMMKTESESTSSRCSKGMCAINDSMWDPDLLKRVVWPKPETYRDTAIAELTLHGGH
jgi:hypothetical protein